MNVVEQIRKLYMPPTITTRDRLMYTHNEFCYAYHPICAIQVLLARIDEMEHAQAGGAELWAEKNPSDERRIDEVE